MHFWIQSYQVTLRTTLILRSREIQYKSELPLNKMDESNLTPFFIVIWEILETANSFALSKNARILHFDLVTVDPDILIGKTWQDNLVTGSERIISRSRQ